MRKEDEEGAEIRRAGLRVSERERRAKKVAKRVRYWEWEGCSLRRAFGVFMRRASSAENWLTRKIYRKYERILEAEISEKPLPEHVAIIMDGNRRYARLSRLSIAELSLIHI